MQSPKVTLEGEEESKQGSSFQVHWDYFTVETVERGIPFMHLGNGAKKELKA